MSCAQKISKPLKETVDMLVNLIRKFFVDEVGCAFNYNNFLQKGHKFVKYSVVDVVLSARGMIYQVLVPNNIFCRNFYLCPSPGCCELPGSAIKFEGY